MLYCLLSFIICTSLKYLQKILVLSQIQKLHLEKYCFRLNTCFFESPRQGKLLLEKNVHNLHNSKISASRFTPDPESQKSNSDREGQQICRYTTGVEGKVSETQSLELTLTPVTCLFFSLLMIFISLFGFATL